MENNCTCIFSNIFINILYKEKIIFKIELYYGMLYINKQGNKNMHQVRTEATTIIKSIHIHNYKNL